MQRIGVVERPDQLHLHRIQVGQAALEVGQLPLLDAMQLLLCSQDAAGFVGLLFFMALTRSSARR